MLLDLELWDRLNLDRRHALALERKQVGHDCKRRNDNEKTKQRRLEEHGERVQE